MTHQDRGHELGWQSFTELRIDAFGRECVVDNLHVGDETHRVVRGVVQHRCGGADSINALQHLFHAARRDEGALDLHHLVRAAQMVVRAGVVDPHDIGAPPPPRAVLIGEVPACSELGITQITERTRPGDQQLGRRGVISERLQPHLHAGFQAAEGDAALADRVVGSDVDMRDRADLRRGIPGSNREVRPDESTQRRDERPVSRFRVRPEE